MHPPAPPAATLDADDPARLRALVEHAPDVIARFDRALRHVYVNRAVQRLTGLAPADHLGRTHAELGLPPAVAALWAERLEGVLASGAEDAFEFELPTAEGARTLHARVVPEPGPDGAPESVVCMVHDVTERARLEAQFRQAQKMEAVGRLAGGVAHDFNNLLTVIGTYCQFLHEETPDDDPRRADVAEIRKATDRAAQLTRQLLAFSRRGVSQPRPVDVSAAVGEVAGLLRRVVGEDVEVATALAPRLPLVTADPGQLEQVLLNLAVNARDAMPAGGVLTLTTAPAPDGDGVRIGVRDTGTGMDEATRARATEPFFTTRPRGLGTGLGLPTVLAIVERGGGRLTIDSAPGRGTEVLIDLPAARAAAAPGPDLGAEAAGGTETVLVVEDEDAVRTVVRRALEARGYRVLDAHDGTEGVAAAARHAGPIHLLVTDVVMPAMGGREVAERVGAARPALRVLFMSGYTDDETLSRQSLGGAPALLQKPFTVGELAHAVRAVLDRE